MRRGFRLLLLVLLSSWRRRSDVCRVDEEDDAVGADMVVICR